MLRPTETLLMNDPDIQRSNLQHRKAKGNVKLQQSRICLFTDIAFYAERFWARRKNERPSPPSRRLINGVSPSSTIYLSPEIDFIALDIICCAATLAVGATFVIPCARLCVDSARLVPGVKFTKETGMKTGSSGSPEHPVPKWPQSPV